MLESFSKAPVSQDVLRLTNLDYVAVLGFKKGLTIDELTDVIAFDHRDAVTKDLMEGAFQRKAALSNKFGRLSRFSDGDWPFFYAAFDRETAEKECSHHYGRKAAGNLLARRPVYYSVVRCTFKGDVIDLRPELDRWPQLLSDDYQFCNELGKEAHDMGCGGFFAPSARHSGGTTVPVFVASTLSNPAVVSTVRLSYNAHGTTVDAKDLPSV